MITPELREQYRRDMAEGMNEMTPQRSFNLGSDARLAGTALEDNPFVEGTVPWSCWVQGWENVERCWAVDEGRPGDRKRSYIVGSPCF